MTSRKYGTRFFKSGDLFICDRWFNINDKIVNYHFSINKDNVLFLNDTILYNGSSFEDCVSYAHDYIIKYSNMNTHLKWIPKTGDWESPGWVQPWNGELRRIVRQTIDNKFHVVLVRGVMKNERLVREVIERKIFDNVTDANKYIHESYNNHVKKCGFRG